MQQGGSYKIVNGKPALVNRTAYKSPAELRAEAEKEAARVAKPPAAVPASKPKPEAK